MMPGPFHEHDCDECVYIGTFPARRQPFPYDLYLSCDRSFYKFIVRTGPTGDYSTTNDPGWYLMAPIVAYESEDDRFERQRRARWDALAEDDVFRASLGVVDAPFDALEGKPGERAA